MTFLKNAAIASNNSGIYKKRRKYHINYNSFCSIATVLLAIAKIIKITSFFILKNF